MKKKTDQKKSARNPVVKQLLTKKEMEVALLIAREYSHKMVAETLKMSVRTVATHVHNIHNKTRTHNAAGISNYIHGLKGR